MAVESKITTNGGRLLTSTACSNNAINGGICCITRLLHNVCFHIGPPMPQALCDVPPDRLPGVLTECKYANTQCIVCRTLYMQCAACSMQREVRRAQNTPCAMHRVNCAECALHSVPLAQYSVRSVDGGSRSVLFRLPETFNWAVHNHTSHELYKAAHRVLSAGVDLHFSQSDHWSCCIHTEHHLLRGPKFCHKPHSSRCPAVGCPPLTVQVLLPQIVLGMRLFFLEEREEKIAHFI